MKNRRVLAVLLAVVVMIAMMPAMAFADTATTTPTTTTGAETTTTTPGAGKTDETPAAPAKSNDIVILGTSDVQEVERRVDAGDKDADFYFDAMIYQIAKDIGGMATVMNGQVDRVILTGEIARSQRLVERLRRRVEFIAPVEVIPGAVEMDALVAGALRMLRGQEEIRNYDTERND